LNKKSCKIPSTTNKVISAHVDLPEVDNARSAYANAFEFGPRDFDAREILPLPLIPPQLCLGRRADSRWALPQISSLFYFEREISEMRRPTGVKFCTMVSSRPNFIMPIQNFGGFPQKNSGAKNMQNLARFWTTLKFGGEYFRNG